jgi:ectoine hydroxylase-related dioxygenase (phytanoyl-CoA dioxygenase family)
MKIIAGDFQTQGYAIAEAQDCTTLMRSIRAKFESRVAARFSDDIVRNRSLIKLLAEDLEVKQFFCSQEIAYLLTDYLHMDEPVQTGPIVTHYTAGDATGNHYGLPYHQDWPSMGTSAKGAIFWTAINDVIAQGPGLRVIPGSHLRDLWPGEQTGSGYVLQQQEFESYVDVQLSAGQILLMSPFLVHKTKTCAAGGWKLSLSCRFDDLTCDDWNRRNFVSAYRTAVDRDVYLSRPQPVVE